MTAGTAYLLDSDVFIAAKNAYYAFDICPGFWKALIQEHARGRVQSIDQVRRELLAGHKEEDLVQWVANDLPDGFFLDANGSDVSAAYAEIMLWVQRNPRFFDRTKAKFATEADGWLAAYSMVHKTVVVTNEQPRPDSRTRVPLPDVCVQFEVLHKDTFAMLRDLGARFDRTETG